MSMMDEFNKLLGIDAENFHKDVSTHNLPVPGNDQEALKAIAETDEMFVQEPMEDILKRADEYDINEDGFLRAVCLNMQTLSERLRQRANLMRLRANEFDEFADQLGKTQEDIKEYVFRTMQHMKDIETILSQHAHVEPRTYKNRHERRKQEALDRHKT